MKTTKEMKTTKHRLWLAAGALLLGVLGACDDAPTEPEHPGKAVYLRYCFACHQAGIAGAPKLGDQKAWEWRLAKGEEALLENVKNGMAPGMPARGACPACDDETLAIAVDYMVANAQ